MKVIFTGLESSGKTLAIASKVRDIIYRNKKWKNKHNFTRKIYSNLQFSDEFYNKNKDFIVYWSDIKEVIGLEGVDIIWDEISSDFSALKREPLSRGINRWLRQGAKQGVHIYATAQEFHDVHLDYRRRVKQCYHLTKFIGSSRSGENLPPIKTIWGLCFLREVKIHPYNELHPEYVGVIPGFLFITKELCKMFNTHQVIDESIEPPLDHIERVCIKPGCEFKRVIHR